LLITGCKDPVSYRTSHLFAKTHFLFREIHSPHDCSSAQGFIEGQPRRAQTEPRRVRPSLYPSQVFSPKYSSDFLHF
jgi:hypothetical protein